MNNRAHPQPPTLAGSYMVLELSNRCNLACVHCAVSTDAHPHHAKTGHFSLELLDSLLNDMQQSSISFDTLILFWLGEPTLHPYFTTVYRKVLRASVRHGTFKHVELHTNAIRLRDGLIQTLLNQAPIRQTLHITIDAIRSETYSAVKGRDQLAKVNANAKAFLHSKSQRQSLWPRTVLQYIVGSNNVKEVGEYIDHWSEFFNEVNLPLVLCGGEVPHGTESVLFFRQLDCPTAEEQAVENKVFETCMKHHGIPMPKVPAQDIQNCSTTMQPCSGFWKSPVIQWDGRVTLCTRDNTLENSIGSIADHSFSDLWWGGKLQRWRKSVALGDYDSHPLCQTCFIPKSLNHTEITVAEIEAMALYAQEAEDGS